MNMIWSIWLFWIERKQNSESWCLFGAPKRSYFGRLIFAPSRRQLLKIYCHPFSSHSGGTRDRDRTEKWKTLSLSLCPRTVAKCIIVCVRTARVCVRLSYGVVGFVCRKNIYPRNTNFIYMRACVCLCMCERTRCESFACSICNRVILCCFLVVIHEKPPPLPTDRPIHIHQCGIYILREGEIALI